KKNEVQEKKVAKPLEAASVEKGDWVKILDTGNVGQVMEIAKDNVILAMGDLRSVVKLKRVEKVSSKSVPKEIRKSSVSNLTESFSSFSTELDLRGRRGEESIYEIEKYLDRAV